MLKYPTLTLLLILSLPTLLAHTHLYRPLPPQSATMIKLPGSIGPWQRVAENPPSQREIELLETNNIINQVYRDDAGREVTLALVYDPSGNRKMAHPQELCLAAAGFELIRSGESTLDGTPIAVQRLLMQRGPAHSLFYYWFKAGPYQSGSYVRSQLRSAWAGLFGAPQGTALIRLATPLGDSELQADGTLQAFARDLLPLLERYLP